MVLGGSGRWVALGERAEESDTCLGMETGEVKV